MNVCETPQSRLLTIPIYGGSADLFPGALVMPGVTAETDLGVAINHTATSNARAIGVLRELHDYSECGDALVNGTKDWFKPYASKAPSHLVSLVDTAVICAVDHDLTSTMAIASMTSTTKIRVSSIENNIDSSFLYVAGGTGIGQLLYVTVDDATDLTVYSAPTTALVAADTLIKLYRLFHEVIVWTIATTTAPTKIGTTAAVGTGRAMILERWMVRRGLHEPLSPLSHHGLTALNGITDLRFYSKVVILDTCFHPIS